MTAQMEPDCSVLERKPLGGGKYEESVVPRCTPTETKPCWNLTSNTQACPASGFSIDIDRKGNIPLEGTQQYIRCLTCIGGNCRR